MVFGHNTNLKLGAVTFHVQTEDRGPAHALLDTTVYYHGRVLHRRTNNYFDLLPLNQDREHALKLRLEEQHRTVLDEIRSGTLQLPIPEPPHPVSVIAPTIPAPSVPPVEPRKLDLELVNAKSWRDGKRAKLLVLVREVQGGPVEGVQVKAEIEGGTVREGYAGQTGVEGTAEIEFDMPRIEGPEAALLIHAEGQGGRGQLRFALRSRSRVPGG